MYGCDDDKMFERYGGKKEQTTVAKSGIQIIKKSSTNHGHEKRPAKERTPIDKAKKMRKENEMDANGNWLLDIWFFFNNNILIIQEHEIFDSVYYNFSQENPKIANIQYPISALQI